MFIENRTIKLFIIVLLLFPIKTKSQNNTQSRVYQKDSLGVYSLYYENGQIEEHGVFYRQIKLIINFRNFYLGKINVRYGLWEYYYKDGVLKKRGTFKKGKKHGLWEVFNEKGMLYRVELYEKDKLIDKRVYIKEFPLWEQGPSVKGKFVAD